ncbi:flagellar hook-associated protein FlgL [Brenneria goodwinii]|uniref:Flagellar hook-associated protein FlgL n=1 Tax=Brenneria goodwinii TaxID=1109412 RepID=A0A0G4K245_9GAMM|nr:flagellar hook-associated protein FlgL [Brenneria goodwinii]MCG8158123.1 flagellar hook-associated protein FlgL [Brenneria goodwinii]MCG8162464.1 flagellar hook-associated protein FlgL [Brenneria goodwinii]MCG8167174.1 flagellar hook-associated protein FlgL [Brenneria goodwinii]MCG8171834.1 flagellar hook-associated protein FlgL [Brenneria goodwinii]MCG8176534.1 flagellar hook-associated protein FlgL [Brenneria goodwinii]
MRLSTSNSFQNIINTIAQANKTMQNSVLQMSSQKSVNSPSDDPIAASQAVILAQTQASSSQYSAARSSATTSLSLENTVLDQVVDVVQSIQTLIVKAGNTTYSDADRQSMATELQGYKDQLLTLANTTDSNGNYIFAGYATESAPFSVDTDGNVTYSGSDTAVSLQVDSNRTMAIGNTGSSVFMTLAAGYTTEPDGSVSESNIFNSIDYALQALSMPLNESTDADTEAYSALMDKANRGMRNSLDNILTVQAEVGSKVDELGKLDSMSSTRDILYSDRMTSLTGIDIYETYSNFTLQKTALQAALTAFSSMKDLSLFQING